MSREVSSHLNSLKASIGNPLKGDIHVPGDKSISHRALMLSALAVGESRVRGLLEGEDVLATAEAMRAMGASIKRSDDGEWYINGVGVGGLMEPDDVIDLGNSGTSARLIMGLIASHDITVTFTGDGSLRGRPMKRVITPLSAIGATFMAREDTYLPLTMRGATDSHPIDYATPVASAQVKSSVLLAGLNTPGITTVREKVATRDHTERMLTAMGAEIETIEDGEGRVIKLVGLPELNPIDLDVPGDISSAAFLLVAASIVPDSDITIRTVGMNPLRTGIIDALRHMGADITVLNARNLGGEPVGDLHVKYSGLNGVDGVPVDASTMIDEFPVLFCAAAVANGKSTFTGLAEMRVKESDRIAVMAKGLTHCGVKVTELEDGLIIEGAGGAIIGQSAGDGDAIETHLDHRIAMSFSVLGQMATSPITIDDASPINTSFPGFTGLMTGLGANVTR